MTTPTTPTNKRRRLWLLAMPFCAILVLGIWLLYQEVGPGIREVGPGIRVTIQNTGSTPLRSVVLYVTVGEYSLGDIAPGASAHATVSSGPKSHLEIGFIDVGGDTKRLNAGGYFSGSCRGTIRVAIKDGAIVENDHQINISY